MATEEAAKKEVAVIVGAGAGLSAALARRAAADGMAVALAARNVEKLADLAAETGAKAYACDVTDKAAVERLFAAVQQDLGAPDLVVFNPSARQRGPLVELDADAVRRAIEITAYGGFLVAQAAVRAMLPQGQGTILFTGASASVKGYPQSAPFAMGKFALRGLAQSMARELAPQGLHIGHVVIDGGIGPAGVGPEAGKLDPVAIADSYFHLHRQPRSVWTWEIEVRPWTEKF
ncbi:MAG TPA: SDR family NAD(P)-dependent oxidoreductase [Kiloniellaceae bacterium]|nr:SDR family NAD(P)-dependent oxidoreductase [Kiloniellaceae bacterium]